MPSPVELTQLKIQYHRNVGTLSASNRTDLGAITPSPGSTSKASAFRSLMSPRESTGMRETSAAAGGTGERALRAMRGPHGAPSGIREPTGSGGGWGGCASARPPDPGTGPAADAQPI